MTEFIENPSAIQDNSEQGFVHAVIHKDSKVLEYGSGRSTIELSKIAQCVVSVEHQRVWYEKLKNELPKNVKLLLAEPDLDYIEGPHENQRSEGNDGTYEEFQTYINTPLSSGPYDVVIIDGRARVECARLCQQFCHEKSYIYVHDIVRKEYQPIRDMLQHLGTTGMMAKFQLK